MKIEDVLRELKNEMTIVLVTNLVQQARRLADRTAFLSDSRLIEVGETEKMFDAAGQPAHRALRHGRLRMMTAATPAAVPAHFSIHTRDLNLWYGDFPGAEGSHRRHQAGARSPP